MSEQTQGRNLRIGDTIHAWFIRPSQRGTISGFRPHNDRSGWQVAEFEQDATGMTIEPDGHYTLLHRGHHA